MNENIENKLTEESKRDEVKYRSPINGSPLVPVSDGLFYSEHDDLFYIVDNSEKIIPMKSPLDGSRLEPSNNGLFYSEHDDLFFIVNNTGKIIPMKSPLDGSRLEPQDDGTFYSEHDDLFFTVDDNGTITLIESKSNESTLDSVIKNIENATSNIQIHEIQEESEAIKSLNQEKQKSIDNEQNERN